MPRSFTSSDGTRTQHSMQSMCRASSIPEADVCAVLLSQDVASEQPRNVAVKAVRSCLSFVLVWAVSSKTLSLSSAFSESEWNQVWMSDIPKNGSVGASSRCTGAAVSAYPVLHCNNSSFVARTRWISISRRFILAELLRCSKKPGTGHPAYLIPAVRCSLGFQTFLNLGMYWLNASAGQRFEGPRLRS